MSSFDHVLCQNAVSSPDAKILPLSRSASPRHVRLTAGEERLASACSPIAASALTGLDTS
jgi:hypothetical protein